MDQRLVGLAFAAGLVAALNPCGFAMLPAYLLLVVRGQRTDTPGRPAVLVHLGRALAATAGMTFGFVTVFGLVGALTISAFATVQRYLPYATIAIGVGLLALGLWLLVGRELTGVTLAPLAGRWAPTARLGSMYGYGISYALASLSCTIGPFLAVTSASVRAGSPVGGLSVYLAYVAGLGLVVGVLAVAAVFASTTVAERLRSVMPLMNRISGVLLVLVGLYVGYYGLYEVRLRSASPLNGQDPVIAVAGRVQGAAASWVYQHAAWPWVLLLAALLAVAWYRRRLSR